MGVADYLLLNIYSVDQAKQHQNLWNVKNAVFDGEKINFIIFLKPISQISFFNKHHNLHKLVDGRYEEPCKEHLEDILNNDDMDLELQVQKNNHTNFVLFLIF